MRYYQKITLVLFLFTVFLPAAQAQEEPREKARELFLEGNKLADQKQFKEALEKYRKANEIYPSYKIDLNIALTLDAMGRSTKAAEYFEFFLKRAVLVAPKNFVDYAKSRFDELKRKLCKISVVCQVEGAKVIVNQGEFGSTPLSKNIYLRPGTHEIKIEKEGYPSVTVTWTMSAGEERELEIQWKPENKIAPAATKEDKTKETVAEKSPSAKANDVSNASQAHAAQAVLAERASAMEERRSKTIWAYSTLGAGIACLAGAGVFYGIGFSQGGSAHQKYLDAKTGDEITSRWADVEAAQTKLYIGHALAGAGALAIGISIYQFLTRPKAIETQAVNTDVKAAFNLIPGGTSFMLTRHF